EIVRRPSEELDGLLPRSLNEPHAVSLTARPADGFLSTKDEPLERSAHRKRAWDEEPRSILWTPAAHTARVERAECGGRESRGLTLAVSRDGLDVGRVEDPHVPVRQGYRAEHADDEAEPGMAHVPNSDFIGRRDRELDDRMCGPRRLHGRQPPFVTRP